MNVVVAVPCAAYETGVVATVRSLVASSASTSASGEGHEVRIVVCVNGTDPEGSPPWRELRALDRLPVELDVISLDRPSKAAAWTRLRQEEADITVFADADVDVGIGAVGALVDALAADPERSLAAGAQRHVAGGGIAGRLAAVPHRLAWGGVLGTLYAARTERLPAAMPDDVILDDAWVFATVGEAGARVVRVEGAVATVRLASTWRDLWRQRVRAEAGKRQLGAWGLPLAPAPAQLSPVGMARTYPVREWPAVLGLYVVKTAAALRARLGPVGPWRPATGTKSKPS